MAGTACELYGNNETINSDINEFDVFSNWLFGKINAECVLQEINNDGCTILLPKTQAMPAGIFKLIIMSPGNIEKVHTIVNAQIRHEGSLFTSKYKKISSVFVNIDDGLCGEISLLKKYLENNDNEEIRCSILSF